MVFLPALFTNSAEVVAMMGSFLPFMCVALLIHTASMATEGMLLAGQHLTIPSPRCASFAAMGNARRQSRLLPALCIALQLLAAFERGATWLSHRGFVYRITMAALAIEVEIIVNSLVPNLVKFRAFSRSQVCHVYWERSQSGATMRQE